MYIKKIKLILILTFFVLFCTACGSKVSDPISIKVLILPKFESGEITGDFHGEAQYYYDAYLQGADEYDIIGGMSGSKLYVKDGIALYITGTGKVNAALSTNNVLTDSRFDFSNALIIDTGCAGAAKEYGVMGDVYVISATVDGELGHRVDSRELTNTEQSTTWFHDDDYDESAYRILDSNLISNVYYLVKDIQIETTEKTRNYMSSGFNGAEWATRDPQVLLGTSYTCDDFWKGETDHANALLTVELYDCPDPYAATEMEDNAIAVTVDRLGYLNHLVILRDAVNTDVFVNGATPESLWNQNYDNNIDSEDGVESIDIFETAMENNFKVGSVIINAYLNGTLLLDCDENVV